MQHPPEFENSEENEDQLPKYQTWPASKSDTRPVERGAVGSRPALTVLRIVLWLLPSIMIPVVMTCYTFLANMLSIYLFNELITFALSLATVVAIGYFDMRISLFNKQIEYAREKNKTVKRMLIFTLCQIFIMPVMWFTLIYGYCLATGQMGF